MSETLFNVDEGDFADEIKGVMLIGQNVPNQTYSFKLIAPLIQGCNEVCDAYTSNIEKMMMDKDNY